MPGGSRALPDRPNLRYLRLEAKRRLAAGEFATLHEAQTAIAREHGQPSWASLKQLVEAGPDGQQEESQQEDGHALAQIRWVISRFSGAVQPGWTAPGPDELGQHFSDRFLDALPPARLIEVIGKLAADLRGDLVVIGQGPLEAQVELNGVRYIAAVEAEPPHRLIGLRGLPTGSRLRDPRTGPPVPQRTRGDVPAGVPALADQAFAELGLPALLLAGGSPENPEPWLLARGWADLDRSEPLDPGHRFPAPGVTVLVTATAVLRLVADGRVGLDRPANVHLRAVRLGDDTITVRELLSHTAGVDNPTQLYAEAVPELATVTGPVIGCSGPRGTVRPSNGGVAVLGQLIADVTGLPYAEAVTDLVLGPLGLGNSSFPARPADIDPGLRPGAVTSYHLTREGRFEPTPAMVSTIPAAGGLWSAGADLVRLGLGWSSLLPGSLAHEALTPQTSQAGPPPQAEPPPGQHPACGLGWLISPRGDMAVHAGGGLDGTATLAIRIRDNRTHLVLTSRLIPVNSIDAALRGAWTNPEE
jgi:CubicO group peptidase (beta-lactamase class C family)